MGARERKKSGGAEAQVVEGISREELARLMARPNWTAQEAALVLREQQRSGLSIKAFVAQYGKAGERLYYWRKRCPATSVELPEASAALAPVEAPLPTTTVREEQELAPAELQQALERELNLEAAGDRQVKQYVMRAVRTEDKMWSVYALRASDAALHCLVRWAGSCDPKPYSLVELERSAPAVQWQPFATLKEAWSVFEQTLGCSSRPNREKVPLLLPVQIRESAPAPAVACAKESTDGNSQREVTVELPSGVRIRIPNGAEPELVRTVLGTTLRERP